MSMMSEPRRCSTAPSSALSDRPAGAAKIMSWIESEMEISGLMGCEPSVERVRIFSTAFGEVIDMLPSYRPFLLALQKEYDGLVQKLQTEYNAVAPLEGRLKIVKVESFGFVGESMSFFQTEIASFRRRLNEADTERNALRIERDQLVQDNISLREASERDKFIASESHQQNLDIIKHLDRCEKQIEQLRKTEKDLHAQIKELELNISKKEFRIVTVEGQLDEERTKLNNMVPKEEHEALRDELRHSEARYKELEEQYAAKQKDYLNIVETYSKRVGQTLSAREEMRPLTPRPTWRCCRGLVDPDAPHSVDKAEFIQDLLQNTFTRSRAVISVFGLGAAAQKSELVQTYTKHPLALAVTGLEDPSRRRSSSPSGRGEEDSATDGHGCRGPGAEEDGYFLPDLDPETPVPLRHDEKVKNLNFSRKKVADFLDGMLKERARHAPGTYTMPFLDFMVQHLNTEMGGEEAAEQVAEFAINIYASVRRYAAEPDFLAYLLLLLNKLPDTAVRDNKLFCTELLRLFTTHFETGDSSHGANTITKSKFFWGLREVLQNKDQKMWQDMATFAFPGGAGDTLIDFESLLYDDFYVISPLVYVLRVQHMEEVLSLANRLEKLVRDATGLSSVVKYSIVQAALKEDTELSLLQAEDYAKAFNVGIDELSPQCERNIDELLSMMRHGDIFHALYFPLLSPDDADHPHVEPT